MVSHTARVWINRVRLPVLHVVSRTGKNNISLSAFVPENVVSRDGFGSPVPRPLYKDASCHHNPNMKFQIQILGICGKRFALHVGYPGINNLEMVMGSDES